MSELTLAQAISSGLNEVLTRDATTMIFGEDVGKNGGVFRITDGLQAAFGSERVFDTPLAESGILAMSIGLADQGFRPLPEIQFCSFILQGMDAVVAHIARHRFRYGGKRHLPITIRTPFGGGVHTPELHSDGYEGLLAQIPGLRVVIPSSAYDAKGLLISAVESNDPVIFMEHLKLYRTVRGEVPDGYYTVPLDQAAVRREGTDVTLVAYGMMVIEALKAADQLAEKGISAEVIDLRTVAPIDTATIVESVTKTHRAVVCQESQHCAGVGAHVASEISSRAFNQLDAPVGRVSAPDTTYPYGAAESVWLPNAETITRAAMQTVEF